MFTKHLCVRWWDTQRARHTTFKAKIMLEDQRRRPRWKSVTARPAWIPIRCRGSGTRYRKGEAAPALIRTCWESCLGGLAGWQLYLCSMLGNAGLALVGFLPEGSWRQVHTASSRPGAQGSVVTTSLPSESLDSGNQLKRGRSFFTAWEGQTAALAECVSGWLVLCLSDAVQDG